MWAKKEFNIKSWPESVTLANLPDKVFGDYTKRLQEIRLRTNLSLEDAFTTAVHEMVHHSQYITGIDCGKIIEDAAKAAGFDRREIEYYNALYKIAKTEKDKPDEIVSYSAELCAVGKGSPLAEAIYKRYRRESRIK